MIKEKHNTTKYTLIILIFLTGLCFLLNKNTDHDVYHYLIYGRDIMETGIPYINVHNIEPELKIVLQEWLYDYVIYGIYKFTGWVGLTIYEIILFAVIFILIYRILANKIINTLWLVISLALVIFPIAILFSLRAQFISIILLLLQIYFIETKHNKWVFPLLLLLEINFHGSFWIFHYVLLLPYIVPWLKNRQMSKKSIIITAIYSLPMMLLNPYGLDTILYPFKAYNSQLTSLGILELKQFGLWSIPSFYILIAIFIFVRLIKDVDNVEFYMFIGLLILSVIHKRNLYFMSFALLYILTNDVLLDKINKLAIKYKDELEDFSNSVSKIIRILIYSLLVFLLLCLNIIYFTTKISSNEKHNYTSICAYLKENNIEEVFTTFNTGTYLEWMGYKVFIDSCPEVFSIKINEKRDILAEYINRSEDNYVLLDNYQYICTDESLIKKELSYRENWELVAKDEDTVLYKNKGK